LIAISSGALVAVAPHCSGQREDRYGHLLGGPLAAEPGGGVSGVEPARLSVMAENERITALENRVAALDDEMARMKAQFADFTRQFQ